MVPYECRRDHEQAIAGILSVDDPTHALVGEHRLSELMRALPEAGPSPA